MIEFLNGNSIRIPLKSKSVHIVVTSPPYYGLRSYSTEKNKNNELGTEDLHDCLGWATGHYCNECYVCHTLQWASEVWRILRDDGTFWLNIADSYSGSGGAGGDYNKGGLRDGQPKWKNPNKSLSRKNLFGIPWRVALALQANGWTLRNELIWWKPNAYPEGGARDRFGRDHEQIFVFSKNKKYFFNKEAVKVPYTKPLNRWSGEKLEANGISEWSKSTKQNIYRKRNMRPDSKGKGQRTVIKINTSGVSGSHFAKFPIELPEIAIKAGTSEYGCCAICGAPYKPVIKRTFDGEYNKKEALKQQERMEGVISGGVDKVTLGRTEKVSKKIVGWKPTCRCNNDLLLLKPAIVFDPFVGSGTTLIAARNLKRSAIGVDLSFHYLNNDVKERLGIKEIENFYKKAEVDQTEIDTTMFD